MTGEDQTKTGPETETVASVRAHRQGAELYETLGLEIVSAADGTAVIEIASGVGLRNSRGNLHGGVALALADIVASCAARSLLGEGDSLSTISVTTNFVRPARLPVQAVGWVVTMGGRVASAQVEIKSDGEIVAHGVATIRIFRDTRRTGKPASG